MKTYSIIPSVIGTAFFALTCCLNAKEQTSAPSSGPSIPDAEVDQLVNQEFDKITLAVSVRPQLQIKSTGECEWKSTPDNGDGRVYINRIQVKKILSAAIVRHPRDVVRFILAHEIAHVMQARNFGAKDVADANPPRRRWFESQADLLAGVYVWQSIPLPEFSNKNLSEEILADILQVSYDLGDAPWQSVSHPPPEVRRMAARVGMSYGALPVVRQLFAEKSAPQTQAALIELNLESALNLRFNEPFQDWVNRQANRVAHAGREAAIQVVFSDMHIQWDERGTDPYVTFSIKCSNLSPRPIHADVNVPVFVVLREDPDNTKYWRPTDSKDFAFLLEPHGSKVLDGRLTWAAVVTDVQKYMPSIKLPPDDLAAAYFQFDGASEVPIVGVSESPMQLGENDPQAINKLSLSVEELIDDVNHQRSMELRGAAGSRDSDGELSFPCSTGIPSAQSTTVYQEPDGNCYVMAWFYGGSNVVTARNKYDTLIRQLKAAQWDGTESVTTTATEEKHRFKLTKGPVVGQFDAQITLSISKKRAYASNFLSIYRP